MEGTVDIKIFRWLIKHNYKININHVAQGAKWYDIEDMKFLIEKGHNLSKQYTTPYCNESQSEEDKSQSENYDLFDLFDKEDNILLVGAARMGNLSLIKWLIEDQNMSLTKNVLLASMKSNSIPVINFLLSLDYPYEILSLSGFAIQSQNIDILDFLWKNDLFYRGDPSVKLICSNPYVYATLMEYGVETHNISVIDWLLKHGFVLTGPSFAYSISDFSLIDYLYRLNSPMDGWCYRHTINYTRSNELNSYLSYLKCPSEYYDSDQDSSPYQYDNDQENFDLDTSDNINPI